MEAKELRLGNWVYSVRNMNAEVLIPDRVGRVDAIGLFGDISLSANPLLPDWTITVKHLSPIPLTPEVLEKCGFLKDASGYIDAYTLGMIKITDSVDGFRFDYPLSKAMLYLHQLQNLFYALTGTELKY